MNSVTGVEMRFLSGEEITRLQAILINYPLFADADSRHALLTNCKLTAVRDSISLEGAAQKFVNVLCSKISSVTVLDIQRQGPSAEPLEIEEPGLVALLEYITGPLSNIPDDDKIFLESVIQWSWSDFRKQKKCHTLQQELQRQKLLPSQPRRGQVKVDWGEIIIGYDLYPFVSEFANQVNYRRAAAFTIGGNSFILRDYIIERMCRELKRKIPGIQILPPINLNRFDNIEDESVLVKKIVSTHGYNKLIDLFKAYLKMNIALIIWNRGVPVEGMRFAARRFWKEVEESIVPFLQEKNRCFVLILAHVDEKVEEYQLDNFTVLHAPSEFNTGELVPLIQGRLQDLGIEQSDVDFCVERLKGPQGDFVETYQQMEYIVNYLQGKYSR